jgi:hypothetical protein
MVIYGKIIKENMSLREVKAENTDASKTFAEKLSLCLISICRQLDIQVPIWLAKNTKELANYKKTFFTDEQFLEKVYFDRFEIEMKR